MKIEVDANDVLEFMDKHWKSVIDAGKADDADENMFHDGMMYMAAAVVSEFGLQRDNVILFSSRNGWHYLDNGEIGN